MNVFRRTGWLALALSAASAAAGAQEKCDINEGSPYQINSAKIYLGKVQSGKESEKEMHLKSAVKVLTENPEKIKNQLGRNWMLARAYYEWSQRPQFKGTLMGTRGQFGFTSNTNETVDLVAAMDSALTAVEAEAPGCSTRTLPLRRNMFGTLFNPAVELFNADITDSAAVLVTRALQVYRASPHAHILLANAAIKKNDPAAAIAQFRLAVSSAGTDTANAKVRRQAMYNMGVIMLNDAEAKKGDEQKAALAQAKQTLEDYLKEVPGDASAQQALARVLTMSGDTAAVASVYAEMVADPARFTDVQLFEAGSGAAMAKRSADAAKLLEAGLAKNPYHRDALYNLSNVYLMQEDAAKMLPVVRRLVEVDPSNPDNWRLLAATFQLQAKTTKDAKLKKAQQDSLLAYLEKSTKMPVRVTVTGFTHSGANHTLTGAIENLGTAAKSYDLKVEFLDAQGNVVASRTANVGPVEAKARKEFSVQVQQTGIVAYRYAAL